MWMNDLMSEKMQINKLDKKRSRSFLGFVIATSLATMALTADWMSASQVGPAPASSTSSVAFITKKPSGLKALGALDLPEKGLGTENPFKNWGLINNRAKSHISAIEAWKLQEGSRRVTVAVIDTGLDSTHPDLQANVWSDPKSDSKVGSKKVYGWNFVSASANPKDEHGHGTHVAGIIGAIANKKAGVGGVAQRVSIMAVKYYAESAPGSVNLRNTVKALNYAIEHGAKIINYSGGGPEFSEEEYLAIKRAEAQGILVVAAAGNERQNTDLVENYYYPSAYRLSNIISVAATDINNNLLPSSNWGKVRVDVAAPGENIFSTLPGGKYGYMSGTSQATAFVSGMAALLLAENPALKPAQIKEVIIKSVDKIPQLANKVASGGRVNAYAAIIALRGGASKPKLALAPSIFGAPSLVFQ